ncbi:MAG TPA: PEP-CTERM sorting domain-containing protein [Pyrinomonadaceae bacterium]|nr:PEP-CTERM sorting domain-containing protein [Pyrinomonadaceae bacterium]
MSSFDSISTACRYALAAALFFTLLLAGSTAARADTLTVSGSGNNATLDLGITFSGASFSATFGNVGVGQTMDVVFGNYTLPGRQGGFGDAGCTDDPCISFGGTLTSPSSAALNFPGSFGATSNSTATTLTVSWLTGPTFAFTTSGGGSGTFRIDLLDLSASNATAMTQMFQQLARITVTQFTPGSSSVPEPFTLLTFGSGLAGLGWLSRRRRARGDASRLRAR